MPEPQAEGIPEGSVAAGRRARLPAGAQPPVKVFINGVEQPPDFCAVRGNELLFRRAIVKEEVSRARWLAMFLGLFGSYRRNEIVDVEYRREGRVELASNIKILP
ncbi:MAG: hypothetical protein QOJ38_1091 [Solirubrobacterales bacterium]|nr:hypothetical protein [Solirubrobacterales bacterium]